MDWYHIVTLIISALSLPTIAGLVWKDIYEKKKQDIKRKNQLEEKEEQEVLRTVIKEEMVDAIKKVDVISDQLIKVSDGTLSSLRNDILTCYYRCHEKGYRNDYDYQNIHDLYKAYTELHGNSFIKDVIKRFDNLLTKEQFFALHPEKKGEAQDGEE